MEHKRILSSSFSDQQDDPPQTSSELNNPPDSPLSGDDTRATAATAAVTTSPPPHKKSRRGMKKRVVSVPIGELNGSRSSSKGDAYPPSDSWAWRKYGQKPIKGSHYPRAYYRCSSSKGCPARKQVERSHVDPTILVITYASDHNHTAPTSKHHQPHHHYNNNNSPASSTPTTPEAATTPTNSSDAEVAAATSPTITTTNIKGANDDIRASPKELFAVDDPPHNDFKMDNGDTLLLGSTGTTCDHFSWLYDVVSFDDVPSLVGPRCEDVDMAMLPVMREEDELLFADLDELPECSVVFRRGRGTEIKV